MHIVLRIDRLKNLSSIYISLGITGPPEPAHSPAQAEVSAPWSGGDGTVAEFPSAECLIQSDML